MRVEGRGVRGEGCSLGGAGGDGGVAGRVGVRVAAVWLRHAWARARAGVSRGVWCKDQVVAAASLSLSV